MLPYVHTYICATISNFLKPLVLIYAHFSNSVHMLPAAALADFQGQAKACGSSLQGVHKGCQGNE